jgi:hypothetical protein
MSQIAKANVVTLNPNTATIDRFNYQFEAFSNMPMNSEIALGAWIVSIYRVVAIYPLDDPAFDSIDAIITTGRAADLFSATRALGPIPKHRFETYRKLSGLRRAIAKDVLQEAESRGYVSLSFDSSRHELVEYQFLNNSREGVLEAAGGIFESLDPSETGRALIQLLSSTLDLPRPMDRPKSGPCGRRLF